MSDRKIRSTNYANGHRTKGQAGHMHCSVPNRASTNSSIEYLIFRSISQYVIENQTGRSEIDRAQSISKCCQS